MMNRNLAATRNDWDDLKACPDCGEKHLPHHRGDDVSDPNVCNACARSRARKAAPEAPKEIGAFSFHVPGGTGAQRSAR